MRTKFHGLTSLGLIFFAIFLAVFFAWQIDLWLALGYVVFVLLAFAIVIVAYCAKCPCKANCAHVIPGWLAQAVDRQPGPYSRTELVLLVVSLALVLLLPNFWLGSIPLWLAIYWLAVILGVIQIRSFVCKPCGNIFCPLNRRQ